MQQKPGLFLPLTSELLKPSTRSVRDSAAADQLHATVHPKRRGRSDYWLAVDLGSHQPPSQRLFGHVTRLQQHVPVHKALHCHVDLSLGRPPNDQWKRRPARPRERWIDQVRKDNGIPRRTCGGEQRVVVTEEQRYTAPDGYAITTTTRPIYGHLNALQLSISVHHEMYFCDV